MGYFPNGTAGMIYEEQWCANCVHSNWDDDDAEGCMVMLAHNIYNYDLCNDKGHPGKVILDWLIPMDGLEPKQCTMFFPKAEAVEDGRIVDAGKARSDRERYEAAMAETRAARTASV